MPRIIPKQEGTPIVTQGFGIIVTATGDWLMASDSEQGAIVWRTFDEATAYLVAQQNVHGVVTPFQWR